MTRLEYIKSSATAPSNASPQPASGSPSSSLQSLLFGIQIGLDTSNNFAYSVQGLAVRTPNGRFVTYEGGRHERLVDVTALIVPVNPLVYRIPVRPDDVKRGDLIVTADPPNFSAAYVLGANGWRFEGLDTGTSEFITFILSDNLLLNFYVRAESLYSCFGLLRFRHDEHKDYKPGLFSE